MLRKGSQIHREVLHSQAVHPFQNATSFKFILYDSSEFQKQTDTIHGDQIQKLNALEKLGDDQRSYLLEKAKKEFLGVKEYSVFGGHRYTNMCICQNSLSRTLKNYEFYFRLPLLKYFTMYFFGKKSL